MASQSEADRILREHRALQGETNAVWNAHKELESKPFDAETHAAHKRRIAVHRARLPKHTAEQRSNRIK